MLPYALFKASPTIGLLNRSIDALVIDRVIYDVMIKSWLKTFSTAGTCTFTSQSGLILMCISYFDYQEFKFIAIKF